MVEPVPLQVHQGLLGQCAEREDCPCMARQVGPGWDAAHAAVWQMTGGRRHVQRSEGCNHKHLPTNSVPVCCRGFHDDADASGWSGRIEGPAHLKVLPGVLGGRGVLGVRGALALPVRGRAV